MQNGKRWSLVGIIGMAFVSAALAQAAKEQAQAFRDLFLELDTNHDQVIERDEVPASARPAFDRLLKAGDANHDGKLEAQEYRAVIMDLRDFSEQARKKAALRFRSMDKNGDTRVSREEFTGPKERFDILDRDHDGFVTEKEMLEVVQAKAAAKKQTPAKKKPAATTKPKASA